MFYGGKLKFRDEEEFMEVHTDVYRSNCSSKCIVTLIIMKLTLKKNIAG